MPGAATRESTGHLAILAACPDPWTPEDTRGGWSNGSYCRGGLRALMKPLIAVIDDSESVREFFALSLEDAGVELRLFASAEESRDFLAAHRPDLVFIDIIMPKVDGLTFLREINRLGGDRRPKVVVMSSKDYVQDRSVAEGLGAAAFLTKPMTTQSIRELVAAHTG